MSLIKFSSFLPTNICTYLKTQNLLKTPNVIFKIYNGFQYNRSKYLSILVTFAPELWSFSSDWQTFSWHNARILQPLAQYPAAATDLINSIATTVYTLITTRLDYCNSLSADLSSEPLGTWPNPCSYKVVPSIQEAATIARKKEKMAGGKETE